MIIYCIWHSFYFFNTSGRFTIALDWSTIFFILYPKSSDLKSNSTKFDDITLFNVKFVVLLRLVLIRVVSYNIPCHFNMIFIRIVRINMLIMEEPILFVFVNYTYQVFYFIFFVVFCFFGLFYSNSWMLNTYLLLVSLNKPTANIFIFNFF